MAFQVATWHQYTWENGFVWEMHGSERPLSPPLMLCLKDMKTPNEA